MSEKSELLDEIDTILIKNKKLNFTYFLYIFLTLSFITMFSFPKVYITQQIYFESRNIAKLKREYETLKEENNIITASVEAIRFKNQILDTLF